MNSILIYLQERKLHIPELCVRITAHVSLLVFLINKYQGRFLQFMMHSIKFQNFLTISGKRARDLFIFI